MSWALHVAVIGLLLAQQSVSSDPTKPWKKDQAEEVKSHLQEDEQSSEYDPWEYGGFESPKLYYEKMFTLYAEGGNLKKVKILVKAGININAIEEDDGETALMKASSTGEYKTVRYLLKKKADPTLKNKAGNTALMLASAGGHPKVVKTLLKHKKTEVNGKNKLGETAIYLAAANKNKKAGAVAKVLLQAGEDPDTATLNGWTPLHAAVKANQSSVVEQLIEYDVDVNYGLPEMNDATALMVAIEYDLPIIVHLLLFGEASNPALDVNARDKNNVTTLMYACVKGNLTVVQGLLDRDAEVNPNSGWDKDTALHRASFFSHVDVARALMKRGARVTAQNYQLVTPLMKASWFSTPEMVSLLLKFGAGSGMHRKSIHGDTALSKARLWGRKEVVAVLEEEVARRQPKPARRQSEPHHDEL